MSSTIMVSQRTHEQLVPLSQTTGRPISQLVEEAVDALERKEFFNHLTARYDELRANPSMWQEIEAERAAESQTLGNHSA